MQIFTIFHWIFSHDKTWKISANSKRINDNWLAVFKSSKANQELYIPVVKVETLKKETVPKSVNVSMATKDNPTTMAGLAEGRIILKNDFFLEKPKFFPSSIKFCDW